MRTKWRTPSPSELTPIIFDMELTHLYTEVFKSLYNLYLFEYQCPLYDLIFFKDLIDN